MLTATAANVGVVRGLPALVGVAAGMAVLMFVVAFGLGTIILGNPVLLTAVKWTGATVLLWLAWKIATSRGTRVEKDARPIGFLGHVYRPRSVSVCFPATNRGLRRRRISR